MAEQERTPKVLIVDDDPRLRDLLRRYLGDNGFSVSVADGAPAMNRIWMRERFDALILDLMLPGEDGLQILRRLRASKDMTPVLMLTARGEDVDRIVGLELGADDYIAKPFNPRELLARIHAHETAHDDGIRQIVELLEQAAQHQRHCKGKDELERAALCHVFCHTKPLPGRSLNISLPNFYRQKRPAGRGAGRFAFHEWYYTQLIVILQGVFLRFLRTTLLFSIGGFW